MARTRQCTRVAAPWVCGGAPRVLHEVTPRRVVPEVRAVAEERVRLVGRGGRRVVVAAVPLRRGDVALAMVRPMKLTFEEAARLCETLDIDDVECIYVCSGRCVDVVMETDLGEVAGRFASPWTYLESVGAPQSPGVAMRYIPGEHPQVYWVATRDLAVDEILCCDYSLH